MKLDITVKDIDISVAAFTTTDCPGLRRAKIILEVIKSGRNIKMFVLAVFVSVSDYR
jgi:hypothetical protein